jgi:hypothetical protein
LNPRKAPGAAQLLQWACTPPESDAIRLPVRRRARLSQDQELHAPDQAADAFAAGAGGTGKAAMLQAIGVPRLSATPPGRRKMLNPAED